MFQLPINPTLNPLVILALLHDRALLRLPIELTLKIMFHLIGASSYASNFSPGVSSSLQLNVDKLKWTRGQRENHTHPVSICSTACPAGHIRNFQVSTSRRCRYMQNISSRGVRLCLSLCPPCLFVFERHFLCVLTSTLCGRRTVLLIYGRGLPCLL